MVPRSICVRLNPNLSSSNLYIFRMNDLTHWPIHPETYPFTQLDACAHTVRWHHFIQCIPTGNFCPECKLRAAVVKSGCGLVVYWGTASARELWLHVEVRLVWGGRFVTRLCAGDLWVLSCRGSCFSVVYWGVYFGSVKLWCSEMKARPNLPREPVIREL